MDGDELLNTPTDDIIAGLLERSTPVVPTLKRNEAYLDSPVEIHVRINDYGQHSLVPGTLVGLIIPFEGSAAMFSRRGTISNASLNGAIHYDNLVLTIRGINLQKEQIEREFEATLNEVERNLASQRNMIDAFIRTFPHQLKPVIDQRKQKLLNDRNLVANLRYPLRPRSDVSTTHAVPVTRKKITPVRTQKPTQVYMPEPALAEEDYQYILADIGGMAKSIERNPSTFSRLDEEALRDMLLVPLNGHFEGAATGETFNAAGKADIIIRADDRNIFIAECKIWRGPKSLTDAIDQLLSYLTWRDTKAAIIVFNRNKAFSAVLSSVTETVSVHPNRKHGPKAEGETRFRYVFGHPNDANREIIVTVLAFDVPS